MEDSNLNLDREHIFVGNFFSRDLSNIHPDDGESWTFSLTESTHEHPFPHEFTAPSVRTLTGEDKVILRMKNADRVRNKNNPLDTPEHNPFNMENPTDEYGEKFATPLKPTRIALQQLKKYLDDHHQENVIPRFELSIAPPGDDELFTARLSTLEVRGEDTANEISKLLEKEEKPLPFKDGSEDVFIFNQQQTKALTKKLASIESNIPGRQGKGNIRR